jgi:rhomboid protease GluP
MSEELLQQPQSDRPQPVSFAQALHATTPTVYVTWVLIALNIAVFLLMVVRGVSFMEPTVDSLNQWGAGYGPLTTHGQWWRLLSETFIHIGVIHLLFNMYVLFAIGPFTERLFGQAGFTVLYLLSGITGSLVSLAWAPWTTSAGASGAIFGLYGGLLGFLLMQRHSIPSATLQSLAKSAAIFIGYNLVYGFAKSGIDMAAHLGGLSGGFLLGVVLARPVTGLPDKSRLPRALAVALGGAILAFAAASRIPKADDLAAEVNRFAALESRLIALFNSSLNQWNAHQLASTAFAGILDKDLIAPWKAEQSALLKLRLPDRQSQIVADLSDYMTARADAWSLLSQGVRTDNRSLLDAANKKEGEADSLAAKLSAKPE